MSLSGIIIFIIIVLVIYYIGMIVWDNYQMAHSINESNTIMEEEIDISKDMGFNESGPIIMDLESPVSTTSTKETELDPSKFPFPWTADQLQDAFENLVLDGESAELDQIIYYTEEDYKKAC